MMRYDESEVSIEGDFLVYALLCRFLKRGFTVSSTYAPRKPHLHLGVVEEAVVGDGQGGAAPQLSLQLAPTHHVTA